VGNSYKELETAKVLCFVWNVGLIVVEEGGGWMPCLAVSSSVLQCVGSGSVAARGVCLHMSTYLQTYI